MNGKYISPVIDPDSSVGKESAYNAGDPSSIPGVGRYSGEGNGSHSSILTWRIHGLYSPQGCRVRCNFHFHFSCEKETSSAILSFSNAYKLFESPIFKWFPVANHISLQFQYQFTYKNIFQIHQKKLNKKYVYPFLFLKADCNVLEIDTIL